MPHNPGSRHRHGVEMVGGDENEGFLEVDKALYRQEKRVRALDNQANYINRFKVIITGYCKNFFVCFGLQNQ